MARPQQRPSPAPRAPSPAPSPALSPRRRRLFLAITLALPWLALAAVEIGLRLAGYGGSYPLFVPYPDQPGYLFVNPDVGKRYFRGPFVPTPQVEFFRADRLAGTFRVVFQGESSAAGFPYGHGGAPSRMLEARLEGALPGRRIEVINTALTAVNSYTLLDQADDIVAQQPDAVVIYAGHNEYYGAFGVGSTSTLGHWPALVRVYLSLRGLRTVQLLENALARRPGGPATAPGDEAAPTTVMELMAGDQRIPLGSRRYEQGLAQFRANLGALLARYRAARIPVFIGTLVSNERDLRPFISGFAADADSAAWVRRAAEAASALAGGDSARAEGILAAAAGSAGAPAGAHYALARLLDARGERDSARAHYRAAKERDELRFRAPEAMNRIIREEAARYGATVVETQRAFERASADGIVGRSLVVDHLHPNADGYFLLADAFFRSMLPRAATGAATAAPAPQPPAADPARRGAPITPVDSVAGLLRVDRLLAGWPFRPRGAPALQAVDTLRPRDEVERLAQALVRGAVSWPEAMDRQRAYFEQQGDADAAIRVARAMGREYRYSPQPLLDAARIALARRSYAEALGYAREANERRETAGSAELVGLLLLRTDPASKQYDPNPRVRSEAVGFLVQASRRAPGDRSIAGVLAAALMIPRLEAARTRAPSDTAILYDLAVAYTLTKQDDEARRVLTELRRVAPGHARARELLSRLAP